MRALGAATALALLVVACGNRPEARAALEPVALPSDLGELDAPVQSQLKEHWRALTELQAEPSAEPARLAGAYGRLGMVLHAYGYQEAAGAAYRNARSLAPGEARWAYYLARVERALGRWEPSREAVAAALALEPGDVPALVLAAESAAALDRREEAAELFRRALARDPACVPARVGLARLLLAAGDAAEAVVELEAALARQPQASPIHYLLGQAYRRTGDLAAARRHLDAVPAHNLHQDALALDDPRMAEVEALRVGARTHDLRALKAAAAGRFEVAAIEYRQALAVDPDRIYARFGLATVLVPLGRRDEAKTELDLLLAADPAHTPSRLLLARLLADEGRLAEAEEQLRKVIALVPDDVEAQRRLTELQGRPAPS